MVEQSREERDSVRKLGRSELENLQLDRLNLQFSEILPKNLFYNKKLAEVDVPLKRLADLATLPFTFKDELLGGTPEGDFAQNLTYPVSDYVRFHRTSGTRGRPLVVMDTAQDWKWWIDSWQYVLDMADLQPGDRAVMPFSFGPFIGFWSAFDAATARGLLVAPTGGMSTVARLDLIRSLKATVLFCTPSYALHLAEKAVENQIETSQLAVRWVIVAGEPGGSIPSIRQRIEEAWGATVIDHSGASEVGPWGFGDSEGHGLFVNESDFIAEFISVESGKPAAEGELSELVLTSLGRWGSPVIRYRTGDLVRPSWSHESDCRFVFLEGGVLSRSDDMMIIRGVNIFPSSVEQILRSFPEVVEYRLTAYKSGAMDGLVVEIEDRLEQPQRVARELQLRLGLKIQVDCVPLGTLPRFEAKGKRFVDERKSSR
jgi:phenylacetate-CoA ligase